MKLWSKGLGKRELIMDFDEYFVERETKDGVEYFYIKGVIKDPVYWDFIITMTKKDIPGLIHIALNRTILWMFIKNIFVTIKSVFRKLMFWRKKKTDAEETTGVS